MFDTAPHQRTNPTQHPKRNVQASFFISCQVLGNLGSMWVSSFCHWKPPTLCDPEIQNDSNKVTRENAQCILHGPSRITFTILYPNPPHDQHITSVRQPLSAAYCSKRTNKKQYRNNKHNKHGDFRSAFVSYRTSTLVQKPGKSCFFWWYFEIFFVWTFFFSFAGASPPVVVGQWTPHPPDD